MTEKQEIEQKVINNPTEILSQDIDNLVQNLKINVDYILALDNITQVKLFFEQMGINSYYDFYFLESKIFNDLLTKKNSLRKLFNKIVGKESIKNSYANLENILVFAEAIGFKKLSVIELKNKIISDINSEGIYNLNDLEIYGFTKFKNNFLDNSYIKYYFYKKISKYLSNMDSVEILEAHKYLGFDYLKKDQILKDFLNLLNEGGIKYLEDIEKIKVREFKDKYITPNPKFLKYIQSLGIKIRELYKNDLIIIGEKIGLKNKKIDPLQDAKFFLKTNGILNYADLRELGINGARDLLGTDEASREILRLFGLEYLQDFREEHIKRFSRYVGLEGICGEIESDENSIKNKIVLKLLNNGVDCDYSLKLFGIKAFKNLFKEKIIGKIRYEEVNNFIKSNVGVVIPLLTTSDLEKISKLLRLKKLTDLEHKEKLIDFLETEGLDLNKLSKNHIKLKYWSNVQFRYFFEKLGLTTVKDLRLEHINELKKILKRI